MAERRLPPDTSTASPEITGAPLSEKAQEAMSRAEEKADERREKHAQQDEQLRQRAAAGPSATSSGIRSAPPKKSARRAPPPIAIPQPGGGVSIVSGLGAGRETAYAPASNVNDESRQQAAKAAFAMMSEMEQKRDEERGAKRTDLMWYVRCHRCQGPGIWIYRLSSNLQPDDWASSYKPMGVMWPSKTVWCQCCHAGGAEVPLKMLHTTDDNGHVRLLRPYPRMVEEISINEYNRLMGQPAEEETETADAV